MTLFKRHSDIREMLLEISVTWVAIAFLLGFVVAGVELIRAVGALIGWWNGGPLHWHAIGVVVMSVVTIAGMSNSKNALMTCLEMVVGGGAVAIAMVLIVAGWLGWHTTVAIIVVTIGAVTSLTVWSGGRDRAERHAKLQAALRSDVYDGSGVQIVLWYYEGRPKDEIAAVLRTTRPTVDKWIKEYRYYGFNSLVKPRLSRFSRSVDRAGC